MSKIKTIFWLGANLNAPMRAKAALLAPHGFQVKFFTSIEALRQETLVRRAGILFISDDGPDLEIRAKISVLTEMPEFKAARLILICQNRYPDVFWWAAGSNFRDFLPLDLPNDLWVQRVIFSCGAQPHPFTQPSGQVTMNNISAVELPARVIWLSSGRIRIECRMRPPLGSQLKLTGQLADELGLKHISITVEKCERTRLVHRFSDAIIGTWKSQGEQQKKITDGSWLVKIAEPGATYRAFVVIKDPGLRSDLLGKLNSQDFTINSALQIQSIVSEPKYFTPEIVFIEDLLTTGNHAGRFAEMLANLGKNTPVIVIGQNHDSTNLKIKFPNNRIMSLRRIPNDFQANVIKRVLPTLARESQDIEIGAVHIPQNDPNSFAQISVPARLLQLHPKALKIALPFDIGCFGLAYLSSPVLKRILGRDAWIKITDSYRASRDTNRPFIFNSEAIFADLNTADQNHVAEKLTELVREHLTLGSGSLQNAAIDYGTNQRTPELGSLKNDRAHTNLAPEPIATVIATPAANIYLAQAAVANPIEVIDLSHGSPRNSPALHEIHDAEASKIAIPADPTIDAISDKALDLAQNVYSTVYDNVTSKSFIFTLIFIAFSAFALAVILSLVYSVADKIPKSGSQYTEELYKFAPHLKKKAPKPVP